MKYLFIISLLFIISSCEKECKLERISENLFDLNKIDGNKFRANKTAETDSLILLDKMDIYEKSSYSGLMNYRECGHFKSYIVKFKENHIQISLRKNSESEYELSLDAQCFLSQNSYEIEIDDLNLSLIHI